MNDSTQSPSVWLVIGDKPGDNAQITLIAENLGIAYEKKCVLPKPEYVFGKPRFKPSLYHLDLDRSDKLNPPWPDLILTIGRRPSMAALWIQEQSSGYSKIVLLGRPKRWMEKFALIIAPPQYLVPPAANVIQLALPLLQADIETIAHAAERRREHWAGLSRPLTALFIGGPTRPYRMDTNTTQELLEQAKIAAKGGFLYISTSRRTPDEVTETLIKHLPNNAELYRWTADDTENPYYALLGLADRFIVTSDSISMLVETAKLAKPLAIYELPMQKGLFVKLQYELGTWLHGRTGNTLLDKSLLGIGRRLHQVGWVRFSRDLTSIQKVLYENRLAIPLGNHFQDTIPEIPDEMDRVVTRIKCLLENPPS